MFNYLYNQRTWNKRINIESDTLVLKGKWIYYINEFVNDNIKIILHEIMEQQTISITKGGIVSQLNVLTEFLARGKIIHSKYVPKLYSKYIRLHPLLLNLFDLIYLMLDKCN